MKAAAGNINFNDQASYVKCRPVHSSVLSTRSDLTSHSKHSPAIRILSTLYTLDINTGLTTLQSAAGYWVSNSVNQCDLG